MIWLPSKLLRGAVGRARVAGTMSSAVLRIGLEPAYDAPQGPYFAFNLTNAVPRGHRSRFECSQSGTLGDTRTGSRSTVVANRRVVARPRTLQFPIPAFLTRSCAFAHATHAPTFLRHGKSGVDDSAERTRERCVKRGLPRVSRHMAE